MKIELHIDELILEGIPSYQREQVSTAIEAALTALVAEHGLPPALGQGSNLGTLTQQVQPGSHPDAIGRQVARAILSSMNTVLQVGQSSGINSIGMSTQNRGMR